MSSAQAAQCEKLPPSVRLQWMSMHARSAVVAVQNAISYTLGAAVLRAFVAFLYISDELS
tara:strand:+ start:384 stop:563 length:180 start_codon:yes stop_codon:yes gene_type:complete